MDDLFDCTYFDFIEVGCSNPSGSQTGNQQPAKVDSSAAPKMGGTLNIALPADASTLDPSFSETFYDRQPYQNIYDKLVDLDPSGKIVPMLAEKWSNSDDKRNVYIQSASWCQIPRWNRL
jgi:peptide/nickel transport system substrate-binding protein